MARRAAEAQLDTKERLLRAGERLFARDGIHGARIRDLNELAGQRNPSALHYHFGSRGGLVTAILLRHQAEIDAELRGRLDELEAAGGVTVREVLSAVVPLMTRKLETESGRDWARIVPQTISVVSDNLRRGVIEPVTAQTLRVVELLRARLADLPEAVRRERLVDYALVLTSLLAERARELDGGRRPALDDTQFTFHLVDVLTAMLEAPSTVGGRGRTPRAARR